MLRCIIWISISKPLDWQPCECLAYWLLLSCGHLRYALADMALVTSLRDGMNLVSMEYVACQKEHCGVLVLSELAGAAQVH